jgi:hypothetical protein
MMVRRNGKEYHVKSNNASSLTVHSSSKPYKASLYYGSVVVQEIVNGVVVSDMGNNTAVIEMTDNSEPGQGTTPDQISVVIRTKDGLIWYSNSTAIGQQQDLKGNVQVRIAATATKEQDGQGQQQIMVVREESDKLFNLTAFPNPATSSFNVKLESSVTTDRIQMRVMDINGRTIEVRNNLNAGQTLRLGGDYRPGIYIIEMIQGNNRKQLKLMKQGD